MSNEKAARRAREIARALGDTLYEKQMAYGNSGGIALGLWQARLAQYAATRTELELRPAQVVGRLPREELYYVIPASLLQHLPRITRLDDRINRLISNPSGDRMSESPWLDAAGDCVIGAVVTEPVRGEAVELHPGKLAPRCQELHPMNGKQCERAAGHEVLDVPAPPEHRYMHAGGVIRWIKHSNSTQVLPTEPTPLMDGIEAELNTDRT